MLEGRLTGADSVSLVKEGRKDGRMERRGYIKTFCEGLQYNTDVELLA